jgi:hypothetical protein
MNVSNEPIQRTYPTNLSNERTKFWKRKTDSADDLFQSDESPGPFVSI